ncbi:unnamed protein product [Lepeophtheirus salmonis]|uniref:(salmon louse) hypothetical protein n=1 Tax=Lepeophtheirus salmonis TaxID=72036 RepID=A0A7R8H5U9_LEPSM|nr:unnamed protein product [Lepeophtheirus salmonis]CAF2874100.1 unnamed protein product [Lepeophtheirus salmonis]
MKDEVLNIEGRKRAIIIHEFLKKKQRVGNNAYSSSLNEDFSLTEHRVQKEGAPRLRQRCLVRSRSTSRRKELWVNSNQFNEEAPTLHSSLLPSLGSLWISFLICPLLLSKVFQCDLKASRIAFEYFKAQSLY